ncbi:hypothetical protein IAD21_03966 [Abditibacteriota bacterium]|nr:hypothetical protein IAD21_03966 [Abditibacteriota bacterium]
MNNLPPISSPTGAPAPLPLSSEIDLPTLAKAQKWVLWGVLANITTVLMTLATQSVAANASQTPNAPLLLITFIRLIIAIGVALAIWNLARTLKYRVPWLPAILSFFPLVGLVVLLVLNSRATTKLKEGGYQVGLLGAKPKRS